MTRMTIVIYFIIRKLKIHIDHICGANITIRNALTFESYTITDITKYERNFNVKKCLKKNIS